MKKGGGGARHYLAFFTYLVGLPIEWTLCLKFLVFSGAGSPYLAGDTAP